MTRLLADENFPFPVVEALRVFGFDVVTLADLGMANQSLTDPAVLKLACDDARAVLTMNRKHFVRLHHTEADHAGIVVCSVDLDLEGKRSAFEQRSRDSHRLRGSFSASTGRVDI